MDPQEGQALCNLTSARGHVLWMCRVGDNPVAWPGQRGQGSHMMNLEGQEES